jgi:hypothetical protein
VKPSKEDSTIPCTKLVREAIESIRNQRQAPENDNSGINAVEHTNDVNSLIEYEKHLRNGLKRELELSNEREIKDFRAKVGAVESLYKQFAVLENKPGKYDEAIQRDKTRTDEFLGSNPPKSAINAKIDEVDGNIDRFLHDRFNEKIALVRKLNEANDSGKTDESIATMQKDHKEFMEKQQKIGLKKTYGMSLIEDLKDLQTKIQRREAATHPQDGGVNPTQVMREQVQTIRDKATSTATTAVTPEQTAEKPAVAAPVTFS